MNDGVKRGHHPLLYFIRGLLLWLVTCLFTESPRQSRVWLTLFVFSWDQVLEPPMSGAVLGHRFSLAALRKQHRVPLSCHVGLTSHRWAGRWATPRFSSLKLLSVLRGALIRLCPDSRSLCNHDYLWMLGSPCECWYHQDRRHSRELLLVQSVSAGFNIRHVKIN